MPASKVQNHQELRRWLEEGKKFSWIIDKYRTKYNVEIKKAMLSNYITNNNLKRRVPRYKALVPWKVKPIHANHYLLEMLRLEERVRRNLPLTQVRRQKHTDFRENLAAADAVVAYDQDNGFTYVKRKPDDTDIIRRDGGQ